MKKPPKPKDTARRLKATIRQQPAVFAVYVVLRLIVVAELVLSILRGEYESAFICLLVRILFILPFFIQQNFGIQLPTTLEIIILLFIFSAEILGELEGYFITYPNWDTMLHTTTGFLCAATGFALIDILNRNSRIKFQLSPIYVALAAFCFSMTVGVLWEFFEFGMDRLFHLDMQKDTVVQSITSVMLDPTNSNTPITIDGIHSVAVNGNDLGFDGYLDIGLYDTGARESWPGLSSRPSASRRSKTPPRRTLPGKTLNNTPRPTTILPSPASVFTVVLVCCCPTAFP